MEAFPNYTKRQLIAGKVALGMGTDGMRFIRSGSDTSFLIAGGSERTKFLHNVEL